MSGRLAGRVAIITGAASGMGAATARLFASEGAAVIGLDLPGGNRAAVVEGLGTAGHPVRYLAADISERAQIEAAIDDVAAREGRIDILFNNAGYNLMKPLEQTLDEEFDRCFAVNVRAVFLACRAVLPVMRRQGRGVILNTSSSAAVAGRGFLPVYSAAKGAILSLTQSLAVAHGPEGIRVNCIVPGSIDTPMFAAGLSGDGQAARRRVADVTPLRRVGNVDDIAQAALFLVSDAGSYLTGVTLPVDGGRVVTVQEPVGVFQDTQGHG